MMVRRKGEISSAAIDRQYPYQVILPAHCYSGTNYRTIHAFCIGLSLAPRGHAVLKNANGTMSFVSRWTRAVMRVAKRERTVHDGYGVGPTGGFKNGAGSGPKN